MNSKASYELIITSKLESIPIPDLSDAIWARIEAQLDNDLPTDDSGGDLPVPGGPSLTRKILTGMGVMTATIALVSLIYFTDEPNSAPIKAETENNSTESLQSVPVNSPAPAIKEKTVSRPASTPTIPPIPLLPDAAVPVPRTIQSGVTLADSASVGRPTVKAPPLAFPNLKPTDTIPRRNRGVEGISDDDYKIEPKKNDKSN